MSSRFMPLKPTRKKLKSGIKTLSKQFFCGLMTVLGKKANNNTNRQYTININHGSQQ